MESYGVANDLEQNMLERRRKETEYMGYENEMVSSVRIIT